MFATETAARAALPACLMCHAPVVVPEIAGERRAQIACSAAAMDIAARFLIASAPDLLVVVSPHTPRLKECFVVLTGNELRGDFGAFGFHNIQVHLPGDGAAAAQMIALCAEQGICARTRFDAALDHGALVPLHFMQRAGWNGRTMVIGLPSVCPDDACLKLGRALARLQQKRHDRVALICSGDMSHRLIPGAPAGYHPRAAQFDEAVQLVLEHGDLKEAAQIDPELRALAGEDVIDSLLVAAGACVQAQGVRPLSYEGPFGVGYLIAILNDPAAVH